MPNQSPSINSANPDSFAELYEKYKNLVFKTAFLILGDASEAEEALQEVFLLVYRSLERYDAKKGAFSTWLHRITLNYCLSHRRKRRLIEEGLEGEPQRIIDPKNDPGERIEKEPFYKVIQALSNKQKAVIILRYYWELPYAEIASILNVPLGTVKSRLESALNMLRKSLGEETLGIGSRMPKNVEEEDEL